MARPGEVEIDLVHGTEDQSTYDLFRSQKFVAKHAASGGSPASSYLRQRRFIRRALEHQKKALRDVDVFHAVSGFHLSMLPAHAAMLRGTPSVVWLTNARLELASKGGLRGLLGLAERRQRMARELPAIVAMSHAMELELLEYDVDPSRIARIPMGVDVEVYRPPADDHERMAVCRANDGRELPTVMFSGRLSRRKRPHLLIEAIALARNSGVEVQAVLLGPFDEPSYQAELLDLVSRHGLEDLVHFNGFVPDVSPLLRGGSMFCLPSEQEGMPAALAEGMASGLVPIVTDFSGAADLVEDGVNGALIEPHASELADRITAYVQDDALRAEHARVSRKKAVDMVGMRHVFERYLRLFSLIRSGGDAADA
jgi:glycosyltransferase involved in cell wall biosynthesis